MSPLWERRAYKQPKTIPKRPSPKHENHILSFAQSLLSFQDKIFPNSFLSSKLIEGISLFISKMPKSKASMTVEAAIVLPLFLFFFLNLTTSIELMRLHGNLQLALWETGNRMTVYGSILDDGAMTGEDLSQAVEGELENGRVDGEDIGERGEETDSWWAELAGIVWSYTYVKSQMVEYLGEDYLEQSPLTYGADGLQFVESNVYESQDCFEVVVTYSVSPLYSIVGFIPFRMSNRYYGHLWNGYEIPEAEAYVYVAETGEVYHTSPDCTHLRLSVQRVDWQEALAARNNRGQKYMACEKCCEESVGQSVYITEEGNCYHRVSDCSGLKRTIACLPISEVEQLRICQRCGQ